MIKQIIGPLEFRGMKLSEEGDTLDCKVSHKENMQGNDYAVYFVT